MRTIEWVVKPSTLCNLRCHYCYEYDGLADPRRMSIEQWRTLLKAVEDYHALQAAKSEGLVQSSIIWHGGEPLTLPLEYLREVLELQARTLRSIPSRILMQTNAYRVTDVAIDLLEAHGVGLSVSYDVVSGVRVSLNRRATEARVLGNLDRLRARGVAHGAITVLAAHNVERVTEVYDFWASRLTCFRILPLFAGPSSRPSGSFEISPEQAVAAMCRLYDHWMETGCLVGVTPLDEWRTNMIRKIAGVQVASYDRRRAEAAFVVSPNGDVYHANEQGEGRAPYWNVFETSVAEMLGSERYERSVRRTEERAEQICQTCPHYGTCNGLPAQDLEPPRHGRCAIAYPVQRHIEASLRAQGYDRAALLSLLAARWDEAA